MLDAVRAVCKFVQNKRKIISKEIIKSLVKLSLSSINEKAAEKYHKSLRQAAVECLIVLGGIYNRKMYIPGETTENDKVRRILIENGGLLALIAVSQCAFEKEIRDVPTEFLNNLDLQDYEY